MDHAAKLEWKPFSKFLPVPEGAVAAVDSSEHFFVGRYLDPETGQYLSGSIEVQQESSYSFGSMIVSTLSGRIKEVSSGEVRNMVVSLYGAKD